MNSEWCGKRLGLSFFCLAMLCIPQWGTAGNPESTIDSKSTTTPESVEKEIKKSQKQGKKVELSGLVIRLEKDGLVGLDTYDAETLFHLAGEAERKGYKEHAVLLYAKLIEEFDGWSQRDAAIYNMGLLLEDLKEYAKAAEAYELLVGDLKSNEIPALLQDTLHAHFRLGFCYQQIKKWDVMSIVYVRILGQVQLGPFERLEALLGEGIALARLGRVDEADQSFTKLIGYHRRLARGGLFEAPSLVSEASFELGELARTRYMNVKLEPNKETFVAAMQEKAGYLLKAQTHYFKAIRFSTIEQAAKSGFRLGWLYENFYDEFLAVPPPPEYDDHQREVYYEEVKRRVGVLLKKAIKIYERTLRATDRLQLKSEWVDRVRGSLERIKKMYLELEEMMARLAEEEEILRAEKSQKEASGAPGKVMPKQAQGVSQKTAK